MRPPISRPPRGPARAPAPVSSMIHVSAEIAGMSSRGRSAKRRVGRPGMVRGGRFGNLRGGKVGEGRSVRSGKGKEGRLGGRRDDRSGEGRGDRSGKGNDDKSGVGTEDNFEGEAMRAPPWIKREEAITDKMMRRRICRERGR